MIAKWTPEPTEKRPDRRTRREQKQEEAVERQTARDERGDLAQLRFLGQQGYGNGREAKRLRAKMGFCIHCGASIPHRKGEGRCEKCMEHLDE